MRVYVAGPYTLGDPVLNVRRAVQAANELFDAGHAPYVPHLTHLWHTISPRPFDDWMRLDLDWLPVCDAVVRLPGNSRGADMETSAARDYNIPVFDSVAAFLAKHGDNIR